MLDKIETSRLVLRRFANTDCNALVDYAGDIDVARATAQLPHPYSHAEALNWVSIAIDPVEFKYTYAIADHDDHLVGCVSLSSRGTEWELGYWLGQRHWHNGYMREAVTALLGYARPILAPVRIHASVFQDNPRSLALLTAFGFKTVEQDSIFCLARGHSVPSERLILNLEEV